ncbi:mechanosensitive ion channel family protein [Paenibacillus kandeliae]|uniref:mechanosensitive ion channel family protein n=1 Tax=Paenibacillus kandeliae TaxID=3231269 RepID=UPI0034598A3F
MRLNWIWDWAVEWYYNIRWIDLLVSLVILALFLGFRKLFTRYLFAFVIGRFKNHPALIRWAQAFEKPLQYFFILIGTYLSLRYFMHEQWSFVVDVNRFYRSMSVALLGWGLYNVSASSSLLLEGAGKRFGLDASSMIIPFLSKVIRFIVILLVITIIGAEWGFSINGVVAGMGLGSLAIALAAQESLSNIIAGIIIILEKPFSKGDWISTPDIEGIVEDITFRSSKIRTFTDALVIVPNSKLAASAITNGSQMGKRKIFFNIKVSLYTPGDRIEKVVARLTEYLEHDESIAPGSVMVKFNEFYESSLGIMVQCFTKSPAWGDNLMYRQQLNLYVMQVLEEEGVKLAFPTQRVLVQDPEMEAQKA